MPYNLYPEQGGVSISLVDPTFLSKGVNVGITPSYAHMWTPGPWGLFASTTATVLVSDTTYFQYIGTIYKTTRSLKVVYYLKTTLATGITYGEIAIFKGAVGVGVAPASLTRLGYLDCNVSSQFTHAPGLLTATISLTTATQPGDDLWIAFASKATTAAQFEALVIDRLATGFFCSVSGQPSVITSPCTTAAVNSTVSGVACHVII